MASLEQYQKEINLNDGSATEEGRAASVLDPEKINPKQSYSARFERHMVKNITTSHADLLLLACCLISGLIDSTVFNTYGTFVSMQTGNTIFVGLGGSNQPSHTPYAWAKSLSSIFAFALGALFFSRFCKLLGPLRRMTLVGSFFIQALFILITAIIVTVNVVQGTPTVYGSDIRWHEEIPIVLLSFQAAGQIVESRALSLSEIPTVVITSLLCDLMSDSQILAPLTQNAKRNRRVAAFVCVLVGAIVGGWMSKGTHSMMAVVWLCFAFKLTLACIWMVWPEQPGQEK